MTISQSFSPEEIVHLGSDIYFKKKEKLEKEHLGEFAVIEVKNKKMFIDKDKLAAIQKARKKYPDTLFYIVNIGTINHPGSELAEMKKHGWAF